MCQDRGSVMKLGLLFLVAVVGVEADTETIIVSPVGDDSPPGNGSQSFPFKTLRHAFDVAGNNNATIHLEAGIFTGDGNQDLELSHESKYLHLVGDPAGGTVILLSGLGPFLVVDAGFATVTNLTITNGSGPSVVINTRGLASFLGVTVQNNTAPAFKGAVQALGIANFRDCYFVGNKGAFTFIPPHPVTQRPTFINCTFEDNVAPADGGAMFVRAAVNISGCRFVGNLAVAASFGGGAIFLNSELTANETIISDSVFSQNVAQFGGGAVYAASPVVIRDCLFENNTNLNKAAAGAAVFVSGALKKKRPLIHNCRFVRNFAGSGAGLFLASSTDVHACTFDSNVAVAASFGGGAIWVSSGADDSIISDCMIRNNSGHGGGAVFLASTVSFISCTFENNFAYNTGGAISLDFSAKGQYLELINCRFENNTATGGGGLFLAGVTSLKGCTFVNNVARLGPAGRTGGGAVWLRAGLKLASNITNCTFQSNFASGGGGALNTESPALISDCIFVNNFANFQEAGGGAVLIDSPILLPVRVTACRFVDNQAKGLGGAVLIGSFAALDGCEFVRNSVFAGSAGGAAAVDFQASATLRGCTFEENVVSLPAEAKIVPNAIWVGEHGALQLSACAFCDHSAFGTVLCNDTTGSVSAGISSSLSDPSHVVSSKCSFQEEVANGILLDASPQTIFPCAVCPGNPVLLYTTWGTAANLSAMPAATAMAVTLFDAKPHYSLTVTAAQRNTSSPAELTSPDLLATSVTRVIQSGTSATVLECNLRHGKTREGPFPEFGIRVDSAPGDRFTAERFSILAEVSRPQLSTSQSLLHVIGGSFAWTGLQTLILLELRDELGAPFAADIKVRIDGHHLVCSSGAPGGDATLHVCDAVLATEGRYDIELDDASGRPLGAVGKLTVVSLAWPIAGGALVVFLLTVFGVWWGYKGWRKRRSAVADKLLANYVGFSDKGTAIDGPSFFSKNSKSMSYLVDKSLLIPFKEIDIRRDIAAGAAGKVSLGTWKGTTVAVKRLYVMPSGDEHSGFLKELSLHQSLRHRNVVQLLGMCCDPLCIVLEFMERGSLFSCLQDTAEMPWSLRLRCSLHIARGVLHRDLKSLNVLVDENWRCKVADFDQSRADADTLTATVGTVLWSAPEVLEGRGEYGKAADVYSFGIVMFECWTREAPFQGPASPGRQHIRQHICDGGRPVCRTEPPESFRLLMHSCWDADPTCRPTFNDVVSVLDDDNDATTVSTPRSQLWSWGTSRRSKESLGVPLLELNSEDN